MSALIVVAADLEGTIALAWDLEALERDGVPWRALAASAATAVEEAS